MILPVEGAIAPANTLYRQLKGLTSCFVILNTPLKISYRKQKICKKGRRTKVGDIER